VSRVAISEACAVAECEAIVSRWWLFSVVRVRESSVYSQRLTSMQPMDPALFNALSASRTRRSRACCRVDSDSFIRETASLSGVMLKLPIVW
jgi:hypothetical protein